MTRPRACIVSVVRPACDVRTFHREARSLAAAGWEVSVVGRDPGPPRTADGVRILPLACASGIGRALGQLHALRLALSTRADVYAVADLELLPMALVLRWAGRAVVYDCIEDYPAYMELKPWIRPRFRPLARRAVAALERLVAPRLDAVLTADAGTATRLRRFGARVSVLHNFPRRDEFVLAPPDTPRPHHVLYHGSLPVYHLLAMARIAGRLGRRRRDVRWTIVGQPDSASAGAVFAEALASEGAEAHVRLHPRVPFPEVAAILRGARTGVVPLPDVPKFRTNVPMKLFEYLAAGVPAVASDLPPTRMLLDGVDAAVLVPPDDDDAFAEALDGLLGDPARAARLARRGREAVEQRFHWEREEQTLIAVYARVLCGPGFPAATREVAA